MKVQLDDGAFLPIRAYDSDAGLDLMSPVDFVIEPRKSVCIDTGVHCKIPEGWFGKLESKSGLNVKHNILCLGGVIDASYRGSIVVKLTNMGEKRYSAPRGSKICQMILIPCLLDSCEIGELDETERGSNGFGSTG